MLNEKLKRFLAENKIAVGLLLLSVFVALYFTVKVVMNLIYFNDPRHKDQDLQKWMTPRYVVMSYDLPKELVLETLQLDPEVKSRKKMGGISEDMGLSLAELTELIRQVATEHREQSK